MIVARLQCGRALPRDGRSSCEQLASFWASPAPSWRRQRLARERRPPPGLLHLALRTYGTLDLWNRPMNARMRGWPEFGVPRPRLGDHAVPVPVLRVRE